MTDLVERLRGSVTASGGVDVRSPTFLLAAADEIERLSAELRVENALSNGLMARNKELDADNERLRAALHLARDALRPFAIFDTGGWTCDPLIAGFNHNGASARIDRAHFAAAESAYVHDAVEQSVQEKT